MKTSILSCFFLVPFFFLSPLLSASPKKKVPGNACMGYQNFEKALRAKNFARCKNLIAAGYDVNYAPPKEPSLLIRAIHREDFEGVRFLCAQGACIDQFSEMRAKSEGKEIFLKESPLSFSKKIEKKSPIWGEISEYLALHKTFLALRRQSKKYPLHAAVANNDQEGVEKSINKASINQATQGGHTPLLIAAFYGYKDLFLFLEKKGAHINAINQYKKSALHYLTKHQFLDILTPLLALEKKDAKLNFAQIDQRGNTPFHDLIKCKDEVLIAQAALWHRVDFSLQNSEKESALHLLATMPGDEMADILEKFLITFEEKKEKFLMGKVFCYPDYHNQVQMQLNRRHPAEEITPLDAAAQKGNLASYRALFGQIENPKGWSDQDGNSLLGRAYAHSKGWKMINFLKKKGFDALAEELNKKNESILHLSIAHGNLEISKDLLKKLPPEKIKKWGKNCSFFESLSLGKAKKKTFDMVLLLLSLLSPEALAQEIGDPRSKESKGKHPLLCFRYRSHQKNLKKIPKIAIEWEPSLIIDPKENRKKKGGKALYGLKKVRHSFFYDEWVLCFDLHGYQENSLFYHDFLRIWHGIECFDVEQFEQKKAAIGVAIQRAYEKKFAHFCQTLVIYKQLKGLLLRFRLGNLPNIAKKK